ARKKALEAEKAESLKAKQEAALKKAAEQEAKKQAIEAERRAQSAKREAEAAARQIAKEQAAKNKAQELAAKKEAAEIAKANRIAEAAARKKALEAEKAESLKAKQEAALKKAAEREAKKQAIEAERSARERARAEAAIDGSSIAHGAEQPADPERIESGQVADEEVSEGQEIQTQGGKLEEVVERRGYFEGVETAPSDEKQIDSEMTPQEALLGTGHRAARTQMEKESKREEKAILDVEEDYEKDLAESPAAGSGDLLKDTGEKLAEVSRINKMLSEYMVQGETELKNNNFAKAREYAKKMTDLSPDNADAMDMLIAIDTQEASYREKSLKTRKEKEAAEEKARTEAEEKRTAGIIADSLVNAQSFLERKKYAEARTYACRALEIDQDNPEAAALLSKIDKEEMFVRREKMRVEGQKMVEESSLPQTPQEFSAPHDEGKSWMQLLMSPFEKKTKPLKDVHIGKTYTVDECVQLAIKRSPRMIVSDEQIKLAEFRIWGARRDLMPSLSGKWELSSGKIAADSYLRHYKGRKYAVEVKQNVFDGFEKWNTVNQAQINLEVTKLEREKITTEIIEETKKAYYSLDKAVKTRDIQYQYTEQVNGLWDIIEKAYQQEIIPQQAYLQAKAENLQANFQKMTAEEDVSLAEMVLFQAMNMEPGESIAIEPVPSPKAIQPIGLENCYALALANRPDYKIKELMVEYYDYERKMKKAKGWPRIDFNGSFGGAYENYEPLFLSADQKGDLAGSPPRTDRKPWESEWYAGLKGSWPLFGNTLEYNYVKEKWAPTVSAFRGSETATSYMTVNFLDDMDYFSGIDEARVGYERAKYELLKARNDILMEVKEIYFKYRRTGLQIDLSKAKLEKQLIMVEILNERRRLGDMEITDLVDRFQELVEYEYGVIQTEADYYISLASLNKTIGVPEYFKPEFELKDLNEWNSEVESQRLAFERGEIGKEVEKFLRPARAELGRGRFERARVYASQAFKVEKGNSEAQELLNEIDIAERAYNEQKAKDHAEKEAIRLEQKAQCEAESAARQKDKEALAAKRAAELEAKKQEEEANRRSQIAKREAEEAARQKEKEALAAKRAAGLEAKKQAIEAERS
ncbi:MAG: TolC family protein, partial [Candidatus Omnitrophica bacterium]|nr:TolC family protein [Candidatus Omnitrophota bacterium]